MQLISNYLMTRSRRPKIAKADYVFLAEFRWHLRRFLHFSESAARAIGVLPQQHQALLAIKGFSGPRGILIGDLAGRLQIAQHSAVGLVNRLACQGYARRVTDAADRRRVQLRLTLRGERVLEQLSGSHREELRKIGPQLSRLLATL